MQWFLVTPTYSRHKRVILSAAGGRVSSDASMIHLMHHQVKTPGQRIVDWLVAASQARALGAFAEPTMLRMLLCSSWVGTC